MKRLMKVLDLPFLPLVLAPLAWFAPAILTGKALFWGTPMLQFVPWWSYAWKMLLSGHLPLWNPLSGMGAPLLANYQSGLFYPPNWLYLLLYGVGGVPALAWGQAWLVMLHLIWAGFGMARLARRLGLGVLAQTIGGLAFGLSGYLVARAGFLSINAAVAWTPWVILALTPARVGGRVGLRRRRRFALLAACLCLQLLAGHAQTTWYTLLLAGVWSALWGWNTAHVDELSRNPIFDKRSSAAAPRQNPISAAGRGLLGIAKAWWGLALAVILACGLAAVQLAPTAEYLLQSQRAAAVDYEMAMTYSFWPWRLLTLLTPDLFGNPAQGNYWGYANYWEDALYIGLLPFLLALGALLKRHKRKTDPTSASPESDEQPLASSSRLRWFLFLLFLLALLLALGKNTPVFPWLYHNVPTFSLFQAPTRYMLWAEFALALLAALGADSWRCPEKRGLYWTRLGAAGAFAVMLGAGIGWYMMGDVSPSFIRAMALAGTWGVGAGLLSLMAPFTERQPGEPEPESKRLLPLPILVWTRTVALFVAADLLVAGWGLNPMLDRQVYTFSPLKETVLQKVDDHRLFISNADEYDLKYMRFMRFDTFDPGEDWRNLRAIVLPNSNLLDDWASTNNFDPLVSGRYANWMAFLAEADPQTRLRLLRLMDVGVVQRIYTPEPYGVLFESIDGSRRVRWLPCYTLAGDASLAWEQVVGGKVDLQSTVVLELQETLPSYRCPLEDERPVFGEAVIQQADPNRLVVHVQADTQGWLLLSDVWYPGWRAQVDGTSAQVVHGDYLFRAVLVPAGEHQVLFTYQPLSFWLGALFSLLGCVIWIVLWRRRPERQSKDAC